MNEGDAPRTEILFLGTEAVVPACGGDTASFIINRKYLVDTGWNAAIRMQCRGLSPLDIEYLFLTHCHHDHYLGLPQLLFYLAMRGSQRPDRKPLKIVGPAEDLERVVALSLALLQPELFSPVHYEPELIPLRAGDSHVNPEFELTTCASLHPIPSLCYRFHDRRAGRTVAFTGDTAYDPGVVKHVAGAHMLIHEASFGASAAPESNLSLHSGAPDAARVAMEAGVGRLALVHCPTDKQQAAVAAAQSIFPNSFWPRDGEIVVVD